MDRETDLRSLGWNGHFEKHFEPHAAAGLLPARVVREDRYVYLLRGACGELAAEVTGKFRHAARLSSDFPAVGDWVAVEPRPAADTAAIRAVLPRTSVFSRSAAGSRTDEQVVAANVETVFLVSGLDANFNLARIERYVACAWDSGANPVVVLNKADLCAELDARVAEVEAVALGVAVLAVSATEGRGLERLAEHLSPGATVAFLGYSGVGKSTLINALLGEQRLATASVRRGDSQGRHTTTRRELIRLPSGALVIDTPGMRELRMWAGAAAADSFADVEEIMARCRFGNCRHRGEPGCAVRAALADGTLDARRYANYGKLKRELRHAARRRADLERRAAKAAQRQHHEEQARRDRRRLARLERDEGGTP